MAAEGGVTIDAEVFGKRLKILYDGWKSNKALWANSNALSVVVGASSDDLRYLKSIALHLWLFAYELPDTLLVFTSNELHVVTSQKKATLLQPLSAAAEAQGVRLVFHSRAKGEDGSSQLQEVWDAVRAAESEPLVGVLSKEKHDGKFAELYAQQIGASGLATVEVAAGVADLLAVKDPAETMNIKKAAMLAARVVKDFVVTKIEQIIDDGKTVKHSKLTAQTEEVISDPSKINVKLRGTNCDVAYPPVFQSGGKFDLRVTAASDDSPLHEGVIVVSIGTRYSSYCANIGRTFIVNPTAQQEAEYKALLAAQEAAIAAMVDGATVASVMEAATKALSAAGQPQLIEKLSKSLGHGMGLEFRESALGLNSKNEAVLRAGMVFNMVIGASGLENAEAKDDKSKVYAIQLADTVIVAEGGKPAEIATASCPKTWDKASYILDEAKEEDQEDIEERFEEIQAALGHRKTLRSDDPNHKSAEQIRKEKQDALLRSKNEETLRRLTAQAAGGAGGDAANGGRKVSEVVAYRSVGDIPQTRDLTIQVDTKSESILLPVYGIMVPFHITTVKNIATNQDQDSAHIRVTFNFNGGYEPYLKFPNAVFLKELTFRSADVKHAAKVVQDMKLLRSAVMQRDKERAERATLVQQEKLITGKRVYKLPDLWIRPNFGGKGRKMPGSLEAHANGFRYSNPKGEAINVMYRNIRHAFFQPAENEMITLLHFHLINPIMIGNKKTKDIQFYSEVMDVVQTLDGGRRNIYDPDEIEEEQRERERRNKINAEFQQFVKRVQELWEKDFHELQLEFDIPFRELGFLGTPHRSSVLVLPTVNCLVELTEMPFTVVSLADIEVVNLERVGLNLKNFDMAIVFKDFQRDVLRIDAIPSKSLDTIKEWLTSVGIKYYESKLNLNWKPILKSIMEDPQMFVNEGGWDFLDMEKSDGEEEDEDEHSEDYAPEGSEEESEDEDEEDEDESVVDSEDDEDEEYSEDEDEEEGLTWEELEEEARRDDKAKAYSEDEEDRRGGRKRGAGGSAGGNAAKKRR